MESRTRVLLLTRTVVLATVLTFSVSGCAALKWPWWGKKKQQTEQTADTGDEADSAAPRVIDPEVERREIKLAQDQGQGFRAGRATTAS